jgi:hypothetical protein
LHEKHAVTTWNLEIMSAFGLIQRKTKKINVEMAGCRTFRIHWPEWMLIMTKAGDRFENDVVEHLLTWNLILHSSGQGSKISIACFLTFHLNGSGPHGKRPNNVTPSTAHFHRCYSVTAYFGRKEIEVRKE